MPDTIMPPTYGTHPTARKLMSRSANGAPYKRAAITTVLIALMTVIACFGSIAVAKAVRADRSDNTFSFTYDASAGRITAASSSLQEKRFDPVSYRIYIEDVPAAPVGRRLKARIEVSLNAKEKRAYRGIFSLVIRDSQGLVIYEAEARKAFVLSRQRGSRSRNFSFRFDLPSGDYSATSEFKASR